MLIRFRRGKYRLLTAVTVSLVSASLFFLPGAAEEGAETETALLATASENEQEKSDMPQNTVIEAAGTKPVSPALCNLASQSDMAVATLVGNEYYFSGDVFARFLNVSAVHYITIESLPDATAGELLIGSERVKEGDTVSAADLKKLSFAAADEVSPVHGRFSFTTGGGYTMTCQLWTLEKLNYAPGVSVAETAAVSKTLYTHRDFVGYGTLYAQDPEGDTLTFEVVSHPAHGIVLMTDRHAGEYVYLPLLGYSGEDSFSYVVYDSYGNYSPASRVEVEVSVPSVSVIYEDMEGRREYNAALTVTEAGVMQGSEENGKKCFCPDQTMSRVDFLVTAMQSAGITSVPETADTGFADNADIPAEQRGYVAAAWSMGYISGTDNGSGDLCYLPDEAVTYAEAAALLGQLSAKKDAGGAVQTVFADMTEQGGENALTRGTAAMMLEKFIHINEEK